MSDNLSEKVIATSTIYSMLFKHILEQIANYKVN